MGEFKGTKGKWFVRKYDFSTNVLTTEMNALGNESICFLNSKSDFNDEANALLISKAPEMLEMLKDILSSMRGENFNISENEIEQLIKEATNV